MALKNKLNLRNGQASMNTFSRAAEAFISLYVLVPPWAAAAPARAKYNSPVCYEIQKEGYI